MYNNIIQAPNFYRVGLYIRLSECDEGKSYESESESIINQRSLLMDYVKKHGFTFVDEYIDDGFTGTNFDRPGFKRLIKDIESGKINCVITKDLSRLGRDYIQCGYYIEQYFPGMNVRYISIIDQVDSFLETANNDIAPFKALFNDMTSKDTSKKIRSILRNKKEQGKFIGSKPCYGYMRDPEDKGHLIPDPEVASNVKMIFTMAYSGKGTSDIVTYLNDNNILSPSAYKNMKSSSKQKVNIWTVSSVNKILKNRMYTGDMVQNMQMKLSYKSQKKVSLEKEHWIIVENTHEPLVNRTIFESIQNTPSRTRKTFKNREKRLFENILYCKECGNALTIAYRKNHDYWTINCNRYSRDPKRRMCEPHFIPYDKLEVALLDAIKKTYKQYLEPVDISNIANEINDKKNNDIKIQEKIRELEAKEKEYLRKLDMLYEDKFKGLVSDEMYKRIANETEVLLCKLRSEINKLKDDTKVIKNKTDDLKQYEYKIKSLIDIENPTRELIQTIIEKIVIDKDKNIEIIYKFSILNSI
ncbi:MAG: recombinase family protein [Bacilli bacterium]|nr:recombinase family protein [Bacilli bacterium]